MPPIKNTRELREAAAGQNFLNRSAPQYAAVNRFTQKLMDLQDKLKGTNEKMLTEKVSKYASAFMTLQLHGSPLASEDSLSTAVTDVTVDLPYYLSTPQKGGEEKTGYQLLAEAGEKYGVFTRQELEEAMNLVGQGMGVALGGPKAQQPGQAQQQPQPQAQPPRARDGMDAALDRMAEIRAKPAPRINDPAISEDPRAFYDYIHEQKQNDFRQAAARRTIMRTLKTLPPEKQEEFFRKAVGPDLDAKGRERAQRWFSSQLQAGNPNGDNLLDNKYWGRTSDRELRDALEAVLPPEQLAALGEELKGLKAPDEPGYEGPVSTEPYKEKIEELKKKTAAEEAAEAQANIALLDEVSEQLSDVDPGFREYIDGFDNACRNGASSMSKSVDWAVSTINMQGFKTLAGGRFDGVFHPDKDPATMEKKNEGFTLQATVDQQIARELTGEEVEDLKAAPCPLSPEAVAAAEKFYGQMDTLDYSNNPSVVLRLGDDIRTFKGQQTEDRIFAGEQGNKYYMFWPLINAKKELRAAVDSGDLEKIRAASENCKKADQTLAGMMATVNDPRLGNLPLFDGNASPTRSDNPLMPAKFVKDFAGINKVNSLMGVNTAAHNFNVSTMDLVKDPVNATLKAYRNYKDVRGIDSRGSIGAKLCWGIQKRDINGVPATHYDQYKSTWDFYMEGPRSRGISGLLALEPDPKKRAEYAALSNLGALAAQQEAKKDVKRFETMREIAEGKAKDAREKMELICKNAAILSADQFSMEKMADALGDEAHPDRWRKELSVDELTKPENLYKLNFRELAQRNETLIREHDAERVESGAYLNGMDTDDYLKAAFSVHAKILKNATADVRGTEDFKRFEESVKRMPELAKDPDTRALLTAGVKSLEDPTYFDTLKTDKSDRTFGRKDSEEYTAMKDSLADVKERVRILTEGPKNAEERKKLGDGRFAQSLREAQEDAFEYARLRTKNGTKTTFSAQSGAARVEESLDTVRKLQALQDELGLRSPAQKLYDQARMDLLTHRKDREWMKQNGAETLAKLIHAKRCLDAGIPEKSHGDAMKPENWEAEYAKLRRRKEYHEFVRAKNADIGEMADSALRGNDSKTFRKLIDGLSGTLSAAYRQQVEAPARSKQIREDYKQRWALEAAADKLGIVDGSQRLSPENPKIREAAKSLRKDPEFKEVMEHLMRGKTEEQLAQRKPDRLDGTTDTYKTARLQVRYEKQAAGIAVEHVFKDKLAGMEEAERKRFVDKQIESCRNTPAFRKIMNEKFEDLDMERTVQQALDGLQKPEKQEELWNELSEALTAELQQKQAAPEAPQQAPGLQAGGEPRVGEEQPVL